MTGESSAYSVGSPHQFLVVDDSLARQETEYGGNQRETSHIRYCLWQHALLYQHSEHQIPYDVQTYGYQAQCCLTLALLILKNGIEAYYGGQQLNGKKRPCQKVQQSYDGCCK